MGRTMDNVNLRTAIYCLPIPTILFYALALAGSVSNSPGIPALYLAQVSFNGQAQSVKFGYFGMCGLLRGANQTETCSTSTSQPSDALNEKLFGAQANEYTKAMIQYCQTLNSKILLSLFAAAGVLFLLGNITLALHRMSVKKQQTAKGAPAAQGQRMKSATMTFLLASCAACLGAATSIAMATHALSFTATTYMSEMQISAGESLQILQWLTLVSSTLYVFGIHSIINGGRNAPGAQGASFETTGGVAGPVIVS